MRCPLLQIIADTIREVSGWSGTYQIPSHEPADIREVSVCLKVCQWSAAYQIPSHEPADIREPVIWYRWNYEPSVSRRCPLNAVVTVWRCPCGSAGIYEPSVSSRCCCDCLEVSVSGWSAAYQIPSYEPAGIYEPSVF